MRMCVLGVAELAGEKSFPPCWVYYGHAMLAFHRVSGPVSSLFLHPEESHNKARQVQGVSESRMGPMSYKNMIWSVGKMSRIIGHSYLSIINFNLFESVFFIQRGGVWNISVSGLRTCVCICTYCKGLKYMSS